MISRLYGFGKQSVRHLLLKLVKRVEGGELRSPTLRKIFATHHGLTAGMYSFGCFLPEHFPAGTVIGRYCSIAAGVTCFNANHPIERRSLHPYFYHPLLGIVPQETIERSRLTIGNDVWIGHNALILPRVAEIGNGAVIGAGSVVTKNVPAYAIVAGNPARVLRYRFSPDVQSQIEASKWWDRPIEELAQQLDDFLKPVCEPQA